MLARTGCSLPTSGWMAPTMSLREACYSLVSPCPQAEPKEWFSRAQRAQLSGSHKPAQACRAPQEAHCRHADTTDTRRTRPDSTGCGWTPRPLPWPGGSFLCRGTGHLPEWWLSHPSAPRATADTRTRLKTRSGNGTDEQEWAAAAQPSRQAVLQSPSGLGGPAPVGTAQGSRWEGPGSSTVTAQMV